MTEEWVDLISSSVKSLVGVVVLGFLTVGMMNLSAQTNEELANQEPLPEGNDARFEELAQCLSTLIQFEEFTRELATQHPELAAEVEETRKKMDGSVIGKGLRAVVVELKRRMGKEYPDYEANSRKEIREFVSREKVDLEKAKVGLANASAMAEGRVPVEVLRNIIAFNPGYRANPLKEISDGWAGGFSTKMDEKEREAHYLLTYPGSWKPSPAASKAELISFWNDAGHGPHRMSFQSISAPDPKYAAMDTVELAKVLIAPNSKLLESGKAKIAGLDGARVVYEMTNKKGDEEVVNRLISYSVLARKHFVIVNLILGDEEGATDDELVKKYDPMLAEIAARLKLE